MNRKEIKAIYEKIQPFIKEVGKANLINPDFYLIALKAALVKSFDFNLYVSGVEATSHSFYLTPTLRGMCEDIIMFNGISALRPADRSELVMNMQLSAAYEGMKNQKEFFETNRPAQPVLCPSNVDQLYQDVENKIIDIYRKYGLLQNGRKPSVKQMARNSGLLPLYEFFYSASSKWVHFSPHLLLRMGWGPGRTPDTTFTFSTEHFSDYYADFNYVYGAYLFVLFYESFKDELSLDPQMDVHVAEIKAEIDKMWVWPEVVTFEEMNQERPSIILYGALQVLEDEKKKKSTK